MRRRLLLAGLSLLGAALVLNTLAGSYYTRRLVLRSNAGLQQEIAARVAFEIETFMEGKLSRLIDFAASSSLHGFGGEPEKLLALALLQNDPSFMEISVLDDQGREVFKAPESGGEFARELSEQGATERFQRAMAGESYISPVYSSDGSEPYVIFAVPVRVGPQRIAGVVSAVTNLKNLWDVVKNMQFGHAGYAYLVDAKGNLIAHRDASLVRRGLNVRLLQEVEQFLKNPGENDSTPAEVGRGIQGDEVISTYASVKKLGWAAVVTEPVAAALREVGILQKYALLLLAIGLLVGGLVIAWASNKITGPILELHKGVQLIGAGNLDHRVEIKSGDEIEELAEGFNKTALELKNSYANLEQKVEQRTQEISALYEVTTAVNKSLDLRNLLDAVIVKITEIFHFEATRVFLLNEQLDQLEMRASFETDETYTRGVRSFRRGEGVVGRVAESGVALIFDDVWTDPRYAAISRTKALQVAQRHFFAVFPIKTQSRVVGVLTFNGKTPRQLTDDEIRLLTSMAEHIGVAVENARLFTDLKEKTSELAETNEKLLEATRAKSEFIAAMSHELRTPLHIIIGHSDLTHDGTFGAVNDQQQAAMRKISRNGRVLLKMINDVLMLSRVEAKKMSLDVATVDLAEVIEQVQAHVEQLKREHHLEISWHVDENIPPLLTDPIKLEEILHNLIGNAFKYTPQGSIRVCIRDLPDRGQVEFSVADTGIGIEPDNFARIFEAFEQVKDPGSDRNGGVGLGLSIVKKYLELMQGDIRVESEPGLGSKFTFSIPRSVSLHS